MYRCVIVRTDSAEIGEGYGETQEAARDDAWESVSDIDRQIADQIGVDVDFYRE